MLLVVAALLLAPVATADESIRVPTEMCRGYFFLPVVLAEREGAADRTLWFLYDTGASNTYADPQSLARVTGGAYEATSRATIAEATSGPLSIRDLGVRVRDLDHLSLALGREIDGILAYDAFRDFLVTLDYGAGEIRLQPGSLPKPDRDTIFSVAGSDDRPWLRVRIGGRREHLLIDSGAASAPVQVRDLDRFDTHQPPRLTHATTGIGSVTRHRSARLDGNARIGATRLVDPLVHETDDTQLIGGEVMRHFVWTFDARNARARITAVAPGDTVTMGPFAGHGLAIVGREGRWEVFDVLPDTPAERAGFLSGDAITHMNGRPVGARGCGETADGATISMRVLRDREVHELSLQVEVLVE